MAPTTGWLLGNGDKVGNTTGHERTLDALILRYIGERLRRDEITPLTARNIRNHLFLFSRSFGNRPLDQLGPRAVERWIEEQAEAAKATRALRLSSVRTFARWAVTNGHIPKDFTIGAPKVRRPRQVPRDMDNDHADSVLRQAHDQRSRLIIMLMFGCGLRCVEISRLNVDDFDPSTGLVHVTGKAMHQRQVPVPDHVREAIDSYLAENGHGQGPMIRRATDGGRLGPERISGLVRNMIAKAGIKIRNYDGRSAHGLRSAAASDLYDACKDPLVVQEFLGHANLQTTSIYLRRPALERVREAQAQRFREAA